MRRQRRFPTCGSVEVHLTTDHGVIQDLHFTGDFFSVVEPEVLAEKLRGVRLEEQDDTLLVRRSEPLQRANVKTQPYPGFPTDMQPQIAVVLSLAQGTSLVTEGVYGASRFKSLDELRRMGAHLQVDGRVAVIEGVEHLEGAPVHACDLRAGAALVIAGLAARGTTEISQIQFIERGYEDLVGKLRAVGADIQMVDVPVEAAENVAQIS